MSFKRNKVISVLKVLINIFWYVLIGGLAFLALVALGLTFVPPEVFPETVSFTLITPFMGVEFINAGVTDLKSVFLSMDGMGLLWLALAAAVVYYLRKIFQSVAAGSPFIQENVTSFRAVGIIVIAGSVLQSIAGALVGLVMMNNIIAPAGVHIAARGTVNLGGLFLGLVILALAEVFRYGTELQNEQNLTV